MRTYDHAHYQMMKKHGLYYLITFGNKIPDSPNILDKAVYKFLSSVLSLNFLNKLILYWSSIYSLV